MNYKNILVTGSGGDIGSGMGRIIKKEKIADLVVGCDSNPNNIGVCIFDKNEIIVKSDNPKYLLNLEKIIKKHEIDLVIPSSEAEIRFFNKKKIFYKVAGVSLLTLNPEVLEVGLDKLATVNFLKSKKLLYPWTRIVGEENPSEIPCVIKNRYGSGSKNVEVVDRDKIAVYSKSRKGDIWQEYLRPDDEEYTCGVYRSLHHRQDIRTIIFKRKLEYGHSVYGEVCENKKIDALLHALANGLSLAGSMNVQLRLTSRGPVIFEINPRFSSTVVFRHLLGFKDLIWFIKEKTGETIESYKKVKAGIKFYRGDCEYFYYGSKKFTPFVKSDGKNNN